MKLRVIPFTECVALKDITFVPKNCCSVRTNEPLMQLCPDGWSGYGGVGSSDVQAGSAWVAELRVVLGFLDRRLWSPEVLRLLVLEARDQRIGAR